MVEYRLIASHRLFCQRPHHRRHHERRL